MDSWRDVAGSKLRPHDFVWSLVELTRIYWTYLRPALASPAVTARLAGAGHLPKDMAAPVPHTPEPAMGETRQRRRAA